MGSFYNICGLLCLSVTCVFFASDVYGQKAPVFVPERTPHDQVLGFNLSVFEDTTDSMSIQEVVQASHRFKAVQQGFPSLGFQRHAHWFHLRINGRNLEDSSYSLHVDYAFIDELSVFEVHDGRVVQTFETGDSFPFDSRPFDYETFLFPLEIQSEQIVDVYFRVRSTESILFPVQFFSREEAQDVINQRSHIYGALFGAMLLIVLYNFFLWLIIRDSAYLFYWLYLSAQATFQFMYAGYAFRYWWPDKPEMQLISLVIGGALLALLAVEFCRRYLDTKTLLPRSDRFLQVLGWSSVLMLVPTYFVDAQWGMLGVTTVSFLIPVSILIVVFRLTFYERSVMAGYLFAAFFTLILSFCITGIAAFGLIEFSQVTLHLPLMAVVVEGTLLSLGLAHKIRTLQNEKSTALELLLGESTRAARLGVSAQRFVPYEFLEFLGRTDISEVAVGDSVAAEMTVLFSDIRSFTTLSEGMSPRENFEFVNEYLGVVTPVIYKHGGFVDKFIGDAVMALFHNGSAQACRCAQEMQDALQQYNLKRAQQQKEPVHSGVGIHTGTVMLGTVGDGKRLQTTVISDAVNLASRVEGLTKEYGHPVLISQAVVDALPVQSGLLVERIDTVRVKGKAQGVTVYRLNTDS